MKYKFLKAVCLLIILINVVYMSWGIVIFNSSNNDLATMITAISNLVFFILLISPVIGIILNRDWGYYLSIPMTTFILFGLLFNGFEDPRVIIIFILNIILIILAFLQPHFHKSEIDSSKL